VTPVCSAFGKLTTVSQCDGWHARQWRWTHPTHWHCRKRGIRGGEIRMRRRCPTNLFSRRRCRCLISRLTVVFVLAPTLDKHRNIGAREPCEKLASDLTSVRSPCPARRGIEERAANVRQTENSARHHNWIAFSRSYTPMCSAGRRSDWRARPFSDLPTSEWSEDRIELWRAHSETDAPPPTRRSPLCTRELDDAAANIVDLGFGFFDVFTIPVPISTRT